jgi:hypothetical protein
MPTPLPLPLSSARELFEKLKRDAALLDAEVTTDRFFNFVITGYSIIDWCKVDPTLSALNVQTLYDDHWLKICGDLANASKHFQLTKRQSITDSASSEQGYGVGRYGAGGYGVGEESITIRLNDGTEIDCLDFVREVVNRWHQVFV